MCSKGPDFNSEWTYLVTRRSSIEYHNTPENSSLCPISHHIGDTIRVLPIKCVRSMTKHRRPSGHAPWIGLRVYGCIAPCLVDTVFVEPTVKLEETGGNLMA